MRQLFAAAVLFLAVAIGVPVARAAEEVTVKGTVKCAKCSLKKSDAGGCQDVLVAEAETGQAEYYVAANEVSKKFGHNCTGETHAVVTGTVTEKDGKKWIAPSKMEKGH